MAHVSSNLLKTTASKTLVVDSAGLGVGRVGKVFAPVLAGIAIISSNLTLGFLPLLVQSFGEEVKAVYDSKAFA